MTVSYSAPPLAPELNASSPFYPTLQSLVVVNRATGMPREMVHNWLPRRCLGLYGQNFGPDAQTVPGDFPFNAAADGSAADYSLRATNNTRELRWPYCASSKPSPALTWTIFGVSLFERMDYFDQFAGIGGATSGDMANHGQQTLGPYQDVLAPPDIAGVFWNNLTTTQYYLSLLGGTTSAAGPVFAPDCLFIQGNWYAWAIACCDTTGTGVDGVTTLKQFRRFYLHNLNTNTRISVTGVGVHQPIWFGGSSLNDHSPTVWPLNYCKSNGDLVLFPGRAEFYADLTHYVGRVKMLGIDNTCWDDSGFAFNVPSGFGGVDQFSTFVGYDATGTSVSGGGIYSMLAPPTSYVTGGSPPTLQFSGNDTTFTGPPSGWLYQHLTNTNTTTGTTPVGSPSGFLWVAYGDCSVTRVSNTTVEIVASRPQGAPALATSYSLYASTSWAFTVTGSPVQTNSSGIFQHSPATPGIPEYYLVTATDGSNTYVYPPTQAALMLYPAFYSSWAGHSIITHTGSNPPAKCGYLALALGMDFTALNQATDGATEVTWEAGSTQLNLLIASMQSEVSFLGRPYDAACFMLAGNSGVDAPTLTGIYNAIMSATATVNGSPVPIASRVVWLACPWNFMGHDVLTMAATFPNQDSVCGGLADGKTQFYVGRRNSYLSINHMLDIREGHPSFPQAFAHGAGYLYDMLQQFIAAPAGQSRSRTGGH